MKVRKPGFLQFQRLGRPSDDLYVICICSNVPGVFMESDTLGGSALHLKEAIPQKHNFLSGRSLSPLPILGIPGWWNGNEDPRFYENKSYFRKKRK